MKHGAALTLWLFVAACAAGQGVEPEAPDLAGVAPDLAIGDGAVAPADAKLDPLASAYHELRGVMHVHSVYSHDACDGDGLPGGQRNQPCWDDLRAAVCSTGLGFVGLTDHPAHMREYSMDGELLFDAQKGDQPIVEGGLTAGNLLRCDDGHTVIVTEGYEGNHTMPIAFARQPTSDTAYDEITDARPLAEVQAMVQELKDHGAVIGSAHSEQSDVSAARLLAAGVDAMEWYNPHGNFKAVLGADHGIGLGALDALSLVGDMTPFMTGATSGAHPDLVFLLLLPKWPQKGFDKWREVQRTRTVTGILGSDVHQNVSVDPLCTGSLAIACQLAAQGSSGKTQALALLASGGQIVMQDGRRLDAYERILRWLENRMLVSDASIGGVRDALRSGRSYGLFSVFGEPVGFRFAGLAAGALVEMGGAHAGPVALTVRVPERATPLAGAQWPAADATQLTIRASVYRTSTTGTELVAEATQLGGQLQVAASVPGAYHVEIWIKPRHLVAALGSQAALADTEYLWLITNPIRVE